MAALRRGVIGVGQWPSVVATWHVECGTPARLVVVLAIDPRRAVAADDAAILAEFRHQVTQLEGLTWIVRSSLLADDDGPGSVTLERAQVDRVLTWLFRGTAEATAVHAFLRDRVGDPDVEPPPPVTISVELPEHARNRRTVYALTVELELRRGGPLPEGSADAPELRSASTSIPTRADPTLAAGFEAALSTPNALLRLARELEPPAPPTQGDALWAVQVGRVGVETPIACAIHDGGAPTIFAPAPASNRMLTLQQVPIRDYTTGVGRSPEPTRFLDFGSIDLDSWLEQLFERVDRALAPEFAVAIQTLSERDGCDGWALDHLARISEAKRRIARVAATRMIPVRAGSPADPTAVRDLFHHRLCSRLSNAYATWAAVAFDAVVNAGVVEGSPGLGARLFGKIVEHSPHADRPRDTAITWAELALADAAHTPLAFLLGTASRPRPPTPGSITLDLTYEPTQIEQSVRDDRSGLSMRDELRAPSDGASERRTLAFVIPGAARPLSQRLGPFEVPVVLRDRPTPPALREQSCVGAEPGESASATARWDYAFTYVTPGHPAQDRLYVAIDFDGVDASSARLEAPEDGDRLHPIAEFLAVVPAIHADFVALLPRVGPTTQDEALLGQARLAIQAFTELLSNVADALGREPDDAVHGLERPRIAPAVPGACSIHEGEIELPDPTTPGHTVRALLVTLDGTAPDLTGTPRVEIDAQRYQATVHGPVDNGRVSYVYVDRTSSALLSASEGRRIDARTFVVPDIDVLRRGRANATVSLTRNEVLADGSPTAEPFVYRTPEVRFPTPIDASLDRSVPIDLSAIDASSRVDSSIAGHLQAFFDNLFAEARSAGVPIGRRAVSIAAHYEHRLGDPAMPVVLPVLLGVPVDVVVGKNDAMAKDETRLSDVLQGMDDATRDWFETNRPSADHGTLVFDVSVFPHTGAGTTPSLRLREVRLPIASVVPPPMVVEHTPN